MTIRNLDHAFNPRRVVVIGDASRPDAPAAIALANLRDGPKDSFGGGFEGGPGGGPKGGFEGGVEIFGSAPEGSDVVVRDSAADIDADLAVLCDPVADLPPLVGQLAERGVLAFVLADGLAASAETVRAMLTEARPHLARIIGPGSLGILVPSKRLNAGIAHALPEPGDLAFVSQSNSMVSTVIDWARDASVGFSMLISLGGKADVDFADALDYAASDIHTRAILLHLDQVATPRKFMSAARAAARSKPIIVLRTGLDSGGLDSGGLAAGPADSLDDAIHDAAFRRAGMVRVESLEELFDAAATLGRVRPFDGDRLHIVTNSAAMAALAASSIAATDARLAKPAHANPHDLGSGAGPRPYGAALEAGLDDAGTDAILVINAPSALASETDIARAVVDTIEARRGKVWPAKPVFAAWLGADTAAEGKALLETHGIPAYTTPGHAISGFGHLVAYRKAMTRLMRTPDSLPTVVSPDEAGARHILDAAIASGRETLGGDDARNLLAAYGLAGPDMPDAADAPPIRLGMIDDHRFGPVICFGRGGAGAMHEDIAVALPPLDPVLARDLVLATGTGRAIEAGDDGAARIDRIADTLIRLSDLIADHPAIAGVDIPSAIASTDGVAISEGRITVREEPRRGRHGVHPRFAVRPYPRQWERCLLLKDRVRVFVRPVRPEDETLYEDFFAAVSKEDLRLRFFTPRPHLSHAFLARLTQIDYGRAMAFVALDPETGALLAVVRLHADADHTRGEYAILVRSDLKGHGLGWALMEMIIDYGRADGLQEIFGEVLTENTTMLAMCRGLGFADVRDHDDPSVVHVALRLGDER